MQLDIKGLFINLTVLENTQDTETFDLPFVSFYSRFSSSLNWHIWAANGNIRVGSVCFSAMCSCSALATVVWKVTQAGRGSHAHIHAFLLMAASKLLLLLFSLVTKQMSTQ